MVRCGKSFAFDISNSNAFYQSINALTFKNHIFIKSVRIEVVD
jgi:hypothetical protein